MGLGAVYYLVKPFGFAELQGATRGLPRVARADSTATPDADQQAVDALYRLRGGPVTPGGRAQALQPTMARILKIESRRRHGSAPPRSPRPSA